MKIDVLSTRQVAQLLGVGEATVKRWADAGEIDCFRTPGGHRKFRLRDVTGERWQACKLSVAEEHVATQAVIDAIARAQPLAEAPGEPNRRERGTAVVAAAAGEQHDIAARMAACLLRARGFEVLAPLAATPATDLVDLVRRSRAQVVVLASTLPADARALQEQIELTARAARTGGGRLLVGGEGMTHVALPEEVPLLRSMRELEQQITS